MMRLHYAGDSVLMADEVCGAVLRYARSLVDTQRSDIVSVPVVGDDGAVRAAEFLLSPASQLFATHTAHPTVDHDTTHVVLDLDLRAQLTRPSAIVGLVEPEPAVFFDHDYGCNADLPATRPAE